MDDCKERVEAVTDWWRRRNEALLEAKTFVADQLILLITTPGALALTEQQMERLAQIKDPKEKALEYGRMLADRAKESVVPGLGAKLRKLFPLVCPPDAGEEKHKDDPKEDSFWEWLRNWLGNPSISVEISSTALEALLNGRPPDPTDPLVKRVTVTWTISLGPIPPKRVWPPDAPVPDRPLVPESPIPRAR